MSFPCHWSFPLGLLLLWLFHCFFHCLCLTLLLAPFVLAGFTVRRLRLRVFPVSPLRRACSEAVSLFLRFSLFCGTTTFDRVVVISERPTCPSSPFRWIGRCLRNFANWAIRSFLRAVAREPDAFVAEVLRRRGELEHLEDFGPPLPWPVLTPTPPLD